MFGPVWRPPAPLLPAFLTDRNKTTGCTLPLASPASGYVTSSKWHCVFCYALYLPLRTRAFTTSLLPPTVYACIILPGGGSEFTVALSRPTAFLGGESGPHFSLANAHPTLNGPGLATDTVNLTFKFCEEPLRRHVFRHKESNVPFVVFLVLPSVTDTLWYSFCALVTPYPRKVYLSPSPFVVEISSLGLPKRTGTFYLLPPSIRPHTPLVTDCRLLSPVLKRNWENWL